MVKIALDTENYDKFSEIVTNLDISIKQHDKKLDQHPNDFLPKNINALKFGLSTDNQILEKKIDRKGIYQFKNLPDLYKFEPISNKKETGRPKKKDLKKTRTDKTKKKDGRPYNIIKKSQNFNEKLDFYSKILFIQGLFRLKKIESEIVELRIKNNNLLYEVENSPSRTFHFLMNDYIILQIIDNKLILFRFVDTMLNNALILRLSKIRDLFVKEGAVLRHEYAEML